VLHNFVNVNIELSLDKAACLFFMDTSTRKVSITQIVSLQEWKITKKCAILIGWL